MIDKPQIREMVDEMLMPIHRQLVDTLCDLLDPLAEQLKELPEEIVMENIKLILDGQAKSLEAGLKTVNPTVIAEKLKEMQNGREL